MEGNIEYEHIFMSLKYSLLGDRLILNVFIRFSRRFGKNPFLHLSLWEKQCLQYVQYVAKKVETNLAKFGSQGAM